MKTGDTAPDFTLEDSGGNKWRLADHRGKVVVLLFYPGDDTPICTKQLCSVRDNWGDYSKTGAEVVGISMDSADSHKSFTEKYDLPMTLLSDESGKVVEEYSVKSWLPGRAGRAVVVIDKTGVVSYHKVQPISLLRPKNDGVLEAIRKAEAS